jgi:hypothetical protein
VGRGLSPRSNSESRRRPSRRSTAEATVAGLSFQGRRCHGNGPCSASQSATTPRAHTTPCVPCGAPGNSRPNKRRSRSSATSTVLIFRRPSVRLGKNWLRAYTCTGTKYALRCSVHAVHRPSSIRNSHHRLHLNFRLEAPGGRPPLSANFCILISR